MYKKLLTQLFKVSGDILLLDVKTTLDKTLKKNKQM